MELNPNIRPNHLTEFGVGSAPDEFQCLVNTHDVKRDTDYLGEVYPTKNMIKGTPIAPGIAIGKAVFIQKTQDFKKIEADSILVCSRLSPVYSILSQMVGGIISERGGVMSSPATIAREQGLPMVTGVRSAETFFSDGDLVLINGTDGNIQLISKSSN